jgi:hypothetical protein
VRMSDVCKRLGENVGGGWLREMVRMSKGYKRNGENVGGL